MLNSEQQAQVKKEGIYFAAGNDDFRAARKQCSDRVAAYNSIANTASPEDRARAWLELVIFSLLHVNYRLLTSLQTLRQDRCQ